ncbi:hypothetical protein [Bradyrhizobium sp. USDA 4353]
MIELPLARTSSMMIMRNITLDFWRLPLSNAVRRRLASIADSRRRYPNQKMALAQRLLSCALDAKRGLYVPLGSHPYLRGRLTEDFGSVPDSIRADEGTPLCFFGNPLLLPQGWTSKSFDIQKVEKPVLRATNAGFLVVTIEHDCTEREHFDQICGWVAAKGHFKEVDAELRKYRDYAGYSVVFSGSRSLHFHFVFCTTHLLGASHDHSAFERWDSRQVHTTVMSNAYQTYWNAVAEIMDKLLTSPVPADKSGQTYIQLKRMPWGIRKLDKDSAVLGLPAGTLVPQLVLDEKLRGGRSSKGSGSFLVPPEFSASDFAKARQHRVAARDARGETAAGPEMVQLFAEMCQEEWNAPFPKPVSMVMKRGEWVHHFQNHPADNTPSTVIRGEHTTLLIQGQGAPQGIFRLPNELTANEIGDYLGRRFGLIPNEPGPPIEQIERVVPYFERLKGQAGKAFKEIYEEAATRAFPHISSCPTSELQVIYRQKLWQHLNDAMFFDGDIICTSGEGIGKTTALFHITQQAALDAAMGTEDTKLRFYVFAFRSQMQANEKAKEYANENRRAFVLKTFWSYYEDACKKCDVESLRDEFVQRGDILSVLRQVSGSQPRVYEELELVRKALWVTPDGTSIFSGTTVLFTTHATAASWYRTYLNRIWHHPRFSPEMNPDRCHELRSELLFDTVVFDEPEWDDFAHIVSDELYRHLSIRSRWNWQKLTVRERKDDFNRMKKEDGALSNVNFEDYSELRFIDLSHFEQVQVDYSSQPFGRENTAKAIYRSQDAKTYYFGSKRWLTSDKTRWVFLTTESFTTEAIVELYRSKLNRPLLRLTLDDLPGVYPVNVPIVKHKHANAQGIQKLAAEILASDDRNVVIADKLNELKGERARTFQGMKGYSGWSEENVFIVLTYIHPEVYGRLNAVGSWLQIEDTIAKYYAAQLSQAVGRNTGFRKTPGTKTVIVTSPGLLRLLQTKLGRFAPRVRLQPSAEKFW